MSFHFYVFICSIATSHAKIEWDTSMGACAQARLVHSIFIPCIPPYRTHSQSGRRPSGRYRSPSVNFLNPWIKYFSSKRARLQATSMSPTACRKHRVCSTLTFYHRLRKYQHSPTDICLRAFCLYSKRQFLRKKYKNIRFCYVKSLYFRCTSKIKKFRTKNPDFGTFLYGIRCFGAFYTKLTCYLFSFSFSSGWKSAKVERFVSFPNIQV